MPTRLKTQLNTIIHHQYANSQILINFSRVLDHDFQRTQHVSWWRPHGGICKRGSHGFPSRSRWYSEFQKPA